MLSIVVRLLFTVTDTFSIPGRGVVLLPELTPVGEERFRVGDPLKLRRPDGAEASVCIGGLEFLKSVKPKSKCELVIMLSGTRKEDIPIGTEVWSVDKS
jgi:hypothetical protein